MAVAGYQTWMQAFPHLATECGYSDPNAIERLVDWLGMQWPSLFLATGFCTSREWEFLGAVDGQLVVADFCRDRRLRRAAIHAQGLRC